MACPDPTTVTGPVGTRLTIPTHVSPAGGEATHPSVLQIPGGLNGFTYWMAMTPYPGGNDDHEDPNIVASNDGVTWVVPPGLVNPIDDQTGTPVFNSDVDLKLGPDGSTLYLFWRTYDVNDTGVEEKLFYSTSADGASWAAKTLFYSSDHTVRRLLSPTLLFEGGAWTMWAVDIIPSPNTVVRLTGGAVPEDAWSDPPTVIDVGPMQSGKEPWHIFVARDGDCYLGLLNDTTTDVSGVDGDLLLITSDDGLAFTNSGTTVIPRQQNGEHERLYRASFVPDSDGGVAGWRVWYAAYLVGPPQVWNIYRTFISSTEVTPPDPTPAPVATAVIRRTVTWFGVHAVTGRIIAELPDMTGEVSRLLSAYTSSRLSMPLPLGGPGHIPVELVEQATAEIATAIVAVVNDIPTWMGVVLTSDRGTSAELVLGTATPEALLLRRRVRDHSFVDVDRAAVAAALVGDAGDLAGVGSGSGFTVAVELTGDLITRDYLLTDRQTVYDALRELAADALEFTVDLDWTDATRTVVQKIIRLAPRIGKASTDVLFETTASGVFESTAGSEATYRLMRDFGSGKYANHVTAVGPGEGADQPASAPAIDQAALDGGIPIVEHVVQVSSSASDQATLDRLAQAELARLRRGAETWQISARLDAYPRPGVDVGLGDDVAWQLVGHAHPAGVTGGGRMVGYAIDQQAGRWSPILLQPGEQVVS